MRITFDLSNALRRKYLIEEGKELPQRTQRTIPLENISKDSRRILVAISPSLPNDISLQIPVEKTSMGYGESKMWESNTLPDTPADWDELLLAFWQARTAIEARNKQFIQDKLDEGLKEVQDRIQQGNYQYVLDLRTVGNDALDPVYKDCIGYEQANQLVQQYYTRRREIDEQQRREREAQRAREIEQAKQDREQRAQEKAQWIHEHGSERLRRRFDAGYDCQRLYVTERAAMEHPEYVVDFDDNAKWDEVACPNDACFEEAERVGGIVVLLKEPPTSQDDDDDYYDQNEFDNQQAVAICSYLGKYDLVRWGNL